MLGAASAERLLSPRAWVDNICAPPLTNRSEEKSIKVIGQRRTHEGGEGRKGEESSTLLPRGGEIREANAERRSGRSEVSDRKGNGNAEEESPLDGNGGRGGIVGLGNKIGRNRRRKRRWRKSNEQEHEKLSLRAEKGEKSKRRRERG